MFIRLQLRKRIASAVGIAILLAGTSLLTAERPTALRSQVLSTWTTKEGLSQDFITAIAQTRDGFLWVGTLAGIARFDGTRFRTFALEGPPALHDRINGLARDASNGLWIGTANGLLHYRDGHFRVIPWKGNTPYRVEDVIESHDGSALLYSDGKLLRSSGEHLSEVKLPDGIRHINAFSESKDGTLWVANDDRVFSVRNGKIAASYSLKNTGLLYCDPFGNVYAGDGHHLFRLDSNRFVPVPSPGLGNFVNVMVDHEGHLWMASGGLHGISRKSSQGTELLTTADGLASDDARILFEDDNHDVWIGTIAGLQRLHRGIFTSYTEQDGLPSNRSQSVAVFENSDHSIWMGALEGGVAQLQGSKWRKFGPAQGVPSGQIRGFASGREGPVVGISDYGLFAYHNGRFQKIKGVPHGYVTSPVRAADGSLWFAVRQKGLFRLADDTLTGFGSETGLPKQPIMIIQQAPNAGMWVGLTTGLYRWNGKRFELVTTTSQSVLAIAESAGSRLIIGTMDGMVILEGGKRSTLKRTEGLPGNMVLSVVEDGDHNLWIATNTSILRLTKADLDAYLAGSTRTVHPEIFTEADGLKSRSVLPLNQVNIARAHDGRLWFATVYGISVMDPHIAAGPAPRPVVDSVLVDDREQTPGNVTIPPGRHRVTFVFTAPYLAGAEHLRFHYRLAGWDHDWTDSGSAREVSYTSLPPGNYRFEVEAENREGVASGTPASVPVRWKPFFWQTKLFIILASLALVAVIIEVTRRRTKGRADRLNLRFQERAAERERIAYQIHDTVIQDMIGAALQLELLGFQIEGQPETAARGIDTLAARMRETIARSRNMVSNLHSTAAPQSSLVDVLKHAEAEFRLGDEPHFHLISEGEPRKLHPLVRDEVYRICREALANAFRHASAKNVTVRISFAPQTLDVEVADDGCGMSEETRQHGRNGHFGLRSMQTHAERIGAKLDIQSEPEQGTHIHVHVETPDSRWARFRRRAILRKLEAIHDREG